MASKTEKFKTVVLTKDPKFKFSSFQMINNLAFPAEKIAFESIESLRNMLSFDADAQNVIVDGNFFDDKTKFKELVAKLFDGFDANRFSALFVYTPDQKEVAKELDAKYPMVFFRAHPPKKPDFTDAFYKRVKAAPAQVTAQNNKQPQQQPKGNANFFEASEHVKVTLENINKLSKDRTAIADLLKVGQRFNGVFGTFAFFAAKEGFCQLNQLGIVIDDICRTYEFDQTKKEIAESHVQFLLRTAKCAFLILKEMREGAEKISQGLDQELQAIMDYHSKAEDISKRKSHDQSGVDNLLDSLFKQNAS